MYFIKIVIIQVIYLYICVAGPSVSENYDSLSESEDEMENEGTSSRKILTSQDYEIELLDTIDEYYSEIEKDDLLPSDHVNPDEKNYKIINHSDIPFIENTLYMILKRMFNHYLKEFPDQKAGLNVSDIEKKIMTLFKSEYVETICLHFPRCLDFIYISTPTFKRFTKILNLHSDLCLTRIEYLKQYDLPQETTNTAHKRVATLFKHFSNKKVFELETRTLTPNDDEKCIKELFKNINRIDKKKMIIGIEWNYKTILCDYFNETELKINLQESLSFENHEDKTDIQTIHLGLKKIVYDQGEVFLKKKTYNELKGTYENFGIYQTKRILNELLLNVVRGVEIYLWKRVSDDETESDSTDLDFVKNILRINELDSFCEQIPLILYYLNGKRNFDKKTFSTYLTLCSDWIHFLNVRCLCDKTENGEMLYNLLCVKQSVIDKILLNYFMIDDSMENEDYFSLEKLEYKSFELIIHNIHTELNKFYESKNIFVWPTFDWLSGVHLFTKYHSSDDMNNLKEHMLTIDAVKIPALQMYNQLLPWNLNVNTMVAFKKITDDFILIKMDQYIWRQRKLIQLYFKHTKKQLVPDEVFQRLKLSTQWYRKVTSEMYKFIHLTKKKFIVSQNADTIIKEIETINRDTIYDNITDALKLMDARYEINWSETDFVFSGSDVLLAHLN